MSAQKEKRPLRIKAGFDPSAPDLHLGHAVLLKKLRQFQDLGHKILFIIGDYTAMIGDPTGRSQTRPALTYQEVKANAESYQKQAFKILSNDPALIEVVWNNDWFGQMTLANFLEKIATRYTVARVLERDDFEKRMAENHPVSIREFIYPLLQGFDSVQVSADVEIGGTDQKFNLLVGRDLQRAFGKLPQIVMTLPLLVGLDGVHKMSKSLGNYIAVTDSPKDIFGKAMSIPDVLMPVYFQLLTDEPWDNRMENLYTTDPMGMKIRLAKNLVAQYYGKDAAEARQRGGEAAEKEAAEFERVFSRKENPDNPDELSIAEKEIWIAELLKRAGAVASTSDAKRLIEQGAVTYDGEKITDFNLKLTITRGALLKVGKKKFIKTV